MSENNGWISVNEQLPYEDGYYLGYCPDWNNPFIIMIYDADLGGFIEYESEITHWRPLPEVPTEYENETL